MMGEINDLDECTADDLRSSDKLKIWVKQNLSHLASRGKEKEKRREK